MKRFTAAASAILVGVWHVAVEALVWLFIRSVYRIRIIGREQVPKQGGVILVANHVSWLDGFLILLFMPRRVRAIAWAGNFRFRWLRRMAKSWRVILIQPKERRELLKSMKVAKEWLKNGEAIFIFPEGGITRTGQVQGFRSGIMWLLKDVDVPVVPVYLEGLWGSVFSFSGGRFFKKWPKRFRRHLSIRFGSPISGKLGLNKIRNEVMQLGVRAVTESATRVTPVSWSFLRMCKKRLFMSKVADSLGADLSGAQLLLKSLVLRRILRRHVLAPDEVNVGVLLPPGAAGVAVNAAIAVDRRTSVNLNYTVTSEIMNACIRQAKIKHVLTSRRFMEKMDFDLETNVVYLEDFKDRATIVDKVIAALATFIVPSFILGRMFGLHHIKDDDVLTIIFTSGSTGDPKGVMLSQRNVALNVNAVDQVVHLGRSDVIIGILPFFHSFGYTITLCGIFGLDIKGVYHFSPLDARQIGQLSKKHNVTVLLSTPTFLRGFLRRCEPEEFAKVDVVVTGAEKLPPSLADEFEEKFNVKPVEGYGATELSPLCSVNVPKSRAFSNFQDASREGSVGRPVGGVTAKVVDLETGEELGAGESGMLLIQGHNVMLGYYGRPDLTAKAIVDGWYVTGDVAKIDEDGFIFITGRESRFSKIAGEMIPHIEIEDKLIALVGGEDDVPLVAVTAVPDEKKGERLIVVHAPVSKTSDEMRRGLSELGLPNLYIPSADSFLQVEVIPVLGTGKLDLKQVKQMAISRYRPDDSTA